MANRYSNDIQSLLKDALFISIHLKYGLCLLYG